MSNKVIQKKYGLHILLFVSKLIMLRNAFVYPHTLSPFVRPWVHSSFFFCLIHSFFFLLTVPFLPLFAEFWVCLHSAFDFARAQVYAYPVYYLLFCGVSDRFTLCLKIYVTANNVFNDADNIYMITEIGLICSKY